VPTTSCRTERGQRFTVFAAYKGQGAYIAVARRTPGADLASLYRSYVGDPIWKECAVNGEYIYHAEKAINDPITDCDYIQNAVDTLNESGIEKIVESSLRHISKLLPGSDTAVCILVADPREKYIRYQMHGVKGFTAGAGKIWLQIAPFGDWLDWVPYSLAHEYHHSVWTSRHYKKGSTVDLLDHLISEGRADSFARMAYPERVAPWTNALSPDQESAVWQLMKPQLGSTSYQMRKRFLIGGAQNIPYYAGYTVGFHIVQKFLEAYPDIDIDKWTAVDPHDILEQSGYDGHP
jgi:uncharacterized protein YjaZ